MGKIKCRVESTSEYREKVKAAEKLGLELVETWFGGGWESADGEPVFMSGSSNEVEKVGYTYFHTPISTPNGEEVVKIKPSRTSIKEPGYVYLTFRG